MVYTTVIMTSDKIEYKICGDEQQFVVIQLDPNKTVIAEAGSMMYMDDGMNFEAKLGDGSPMGSGMLGSLMSAGKRLVGGDSFFLTHFENKTSSKRKVAFSAPFPGKIIAVNLSKHDGQLLCQRDSFLCAAYGTHLSVALTKRFGAGFFGGTGFILQKLIGDGLAFMHAGGTVIRKELKGERLIVDAGCLVAFEQGVDYSIQRAGNLKSMIFGGAGLFMATLQGQGSVWIQSLPFSRLCDRIYHSLPQEKRQ